MKLSRTLAVMAPIVIAAASTGRAAPPSFQGIGMVPTRDFSSAFAVSADGRVVVGSSKRASLYCSTEAARWEDGIITGLGDFAGGDFCSVAYAASADGSVLVGRGELEDGDEAFRWEDGVMESLGEIPGGTHWAVATDVSADGSTVVGYSSIAVGYAAVRWHEGQTDQFDDLPGGIDSCAAYGITPDGSIIVGYGTTDTDREAVRWVNGSIEAIGNLTDGMETCALDVNSDGSVVVGYAIPQSSRQAVRWDNGVMTPLGTLPGGNRSSQANAVSADGTRVVGTVYVDGQGDVAFIWDAEHGMRTVPDALAEDYGIDVGEWDLEDARDMSADGMTIVGLGSNSTNTREGWVAYLPIYPDTVPTLSEYGLAVMGGLLLLAGVVVVRRRGVA